MYCFILDAVRIVSEMWKNLNADTKEKMTEMYSRELEKYKEGINLYKQSLTEDQKNELFRVKYEQLEQKTKRKLKKVIIFVDEMEQFECNLCLILLLFRN